MNVGRGGGYKYVIGNLGIILSIGIYLYYGEENLVSMCNERPGKDENNSDTKSRKYAITLLAAAVSVTFYMRNYFSNTPVPELDYTLAIIIFPALLILPIGLILYIIIKGYLLEEKKDSRVRLISFMSKYYRYLFLISGLVSLYILLAVLISLLAVLEPSFGNLILFVASFIMDYSPHLIVIIILILSIPIICILNKSTKDQFSSFVITAVLFLVSLFIWLLLYSSLVHHPQGHIAIDMESIYYKSDEQIPVLIQVTGPDTVLSVRLSNITKYNNLNARAFIKKLGPYPNQKVEHDDSLIGYPLSSGKYIVFINTTNLSIGYYKLEFTRAKNNLSDAKGFYLSDNSKTQINKAVTAASHYNV